MLGGAHRDEGKGQGKPPHPRLGLWRDYDALAFAHLRDAACTRQVPIMSCLACCWRAAIPEIARRDVFSSLKKRLHATQRLEANMVHHEPARAYKKGCMAWHGGTATD